MYLPSRRAIDLFFFSFSCYHNHSYLLHSTLDTIPYAVDVPLSPFHNTHSALHDSASATWRIIEKFSIFFLTIFDLKLSFFFDFSPFNFFFQKILRKIKKVSKKNKKNSKSFFIFLKFLGNFLLMLFLVHFSFLFNHKRRQFH